MARLRNPTAQAVDAIGSHLGRHAALPPAGIRSAVLATCTWLEVRVRVAVGRDRLDRALAAGVDPVTSAELALRAARIVRSRNRRGLARCLRSTIWEAEAGIWALRASVRPVRRAEILGCREELLCLSERLESKCPADPEGVAITERLLTDPTSPLFVWAEPGTVRRLARLATSALDVGQPGKQDRTIR